MTNNEIWQAVLSELELNISKANFNTWFKNTGIVSFQESHVVLCVPNTFNQAWIEKKHHQQIIQSLERITSLPIRKLEYKIENIKNVTELTINTSITPPQAHQEEKVSFSTASQSTPLISPGFSINPKYTFDNFVVGKGSELAFTAAKAVADRPGESYNPLFIYGGVGLGKTHLLQAVANELLRKNPQTNIMYVSAEKFTNDFITSLRTGSSRDFQNRYRLIDALLIDDIQFIAGKDASQESFFHTFNELHQANKQVILTSDRPPKAIPALEDRLKSRFEWGMIVDVTAPDFETRAAILDKKCHEKNFPLETKILHTVATIVQSNIRELEGALNKIIAYHQLKNMVPTQESVKSLLSSFEDVCGKSREKKLSFPRQVIMYLLRNDLKMSFPAIGDELGGRDHTTAMHANEKISKEVENELKLKQEVELIRQRLYINNI
ncbi:MAG: chromosomal replication initiator protein DnaA [Candidatus Magasanikbacteria bacterium]|nr:chromosomal replication initiator protein DnaA [Candidatus Magasanikbacteria bacterium]